VDEGGGAGHVAGCFGGRMVRPGIPLTRLIGEGRNAVQVKATVK